MFALRTFHALACALALSGCVGETSSGDAKDASPPVGGGGGGGGGQGGTGGATADTGVVGGNGGTVNPGGSGGLGGSGGALPADSGPAGGSPLADVGPGGALPPADTGPMGGNPVGDLGPGGAPPPVDSPRDAGGTPLVLRLDRPAPVGGVEVGLTATPPAALLVPQVLFIPAGQSQAAITAEGLAAARGVLSSRRATPTAPWRPAWT